MGNVIGGAKLRDGQREKKENAGKSLEREGSRAGVGKEGGPTKPNEKQQPRDVPPPPQINNPPHPAYATRHAELFTFFQRITSHDPSPHAFKRLTCPFLDGGQSPVAILTNREVGPDDLVETFREGDHRVKKLLWECGISIGVSNILRARLGRFCVGNKAKRNAANGFVKLEEYGNGIEPASKSKDPSRKRSREQGAADPKRIKLERE